MPTLRSATANASPMGTPLPAETSTPRSVKRRLTPGRAGASRHTSPHRHPHASTGPVHVPKMLSASPKSSRKRLYGDFVAAEKPKWNPRDAAQMRAVKEALHVATVPSSELVCRDNELRRVLEFCEACVEQEKAGSLYVCGCPGTGKTLSINKIKDSLVCWGNETPDALTINCTNLANTSDIFGKILETFQNRKKGRNKLSALQQLQSMFSNKDSAPRRMMLVIVDEMDYLITRDRAVLHDLFMLTTCPFSRCILIGIANAIDLADRFLPKLESLNCKPLVVTFRAYSKDQISDIVKHRLNVAIGLLHVLSIQVLEYDVFEPIALEFCARKVAAASGDMRKALGVCRSAVEVLEARLQDFPDIELGIVTFDHMDIALSKAFKSAVVDSILSLPQHQQCSLCYTSSSLILIYKLLADGAVRAGKYLSALQEKGYYSRRDQPRFQQLECLNFLTCVWFLSDQGFMKLGQSKEDKLRIVTLQIDSSDITFAFKGNRFFQKCLELPRC
ncbi:Cell division control protein 6 [Zea mays]|uniref:Cell division control protein n=1 Tax=Zea mays TaxID=4577 RepID=A0A3L6FMP7_MAIZE|nr:Cell division control protein 6 [Zea mays]